MLTSLALIFLVELAGASLCQKLKLSRIVGMLIVGIALGPYVLDLLDPSVLSVSAELRKMALIIILLKAGLSLDLSDLKKVGRPAIMMSFVPASFEILAVVLFAPGILGITRVEAAVMEAGAAAVGMIFLALAVRSIGVMLCMAGSPLNGKERLFCVIAYLPKATVQAAIGSVPLPLGLPCGKIVLSVAVLAILITALLGALGMDISYPKLLTKDGSANK